MQIICCWSTSFRYCSHANHKLICFLFHLFSSDRHRTVHMSGESVVAISSGDSRVHFIDMQSAQERPTLLIGHAASIRSMVVQEDRKKMFTVICWSNYKNFIERKHHWSSFLIFAGKLRSNSTCLESWNGTLHKAVPRTRTHSHVLSCFSWFDCSRWQW